MRVEGREDLGTNTKVDREGRGRYGKERCPRGAPHIRSGGSGARRGGLGRHPIEYVGRD